MDSYRTMITEKQKYLQWVDKEKQKGLIGIHIQFASQASKGVTEEELYGELNRMIEAPDLPDPEVLGNRSI